MLINCYIWWSLHEGTQWNKTSYIIRFLETIFTIRFIKTKIWRSLRIRTWTWISFDSAKNKSELIQLMKNNPYVKFTELWYKIFVYSFQYHCSHELNSFELRKYDWDLLLPNRKLLLVFEGNKEPFTLNKVWYLTCKWNARFMWSFIFCMITFWEKKR